MNQEVTTAPPDEPTPRRSQGPDDGRLEADVLVVGGGPGGAATAFHLASHGVDVLCVDKATFPREKVCGDGLTPRGVRAVQKMGVDPDEPGFVRTNALRTYGENGVVLNLPWPKLDDFPPFGLVRTRHDFDDLLLQRAVKAGARLWEAAEATAPTFDRGWVTGATIKDTDGRTQDVKARFVIAADGASSRFAKKAGVERDQTRPLGIAARRYYRTSRRQDPVLESFLNLRDHDAFLPGYGWIFPLGDGVLNVGAGLLNTFRDFKGISARKVFEVFIANVPPEFELDEEHAISPLLSGPLPMGMNRRPLAVPGLLLVGDAGGIVNPYNGEGIAYAMESGELAAEVIADALAKDRPGIAAMYPSLLRERYGSYFHTGRWFVKAIGNPLVMQLAVKYGFPQETLMRFALRFMANLSDGKKGTGQDKLMYVLQLLASEN